MTGFDLPQNFHFDPESLLRSVDAYQRHHMESAIASADVNGVAGKSWATNKSTSAWSTAVAFYPRVPEVSFMFSQGRRRCVEFN